MRETVSAAESGLTAADAWRGLAEYIRECVALGTGALGALAGTFETTPEMWDLSRRGRDLLEELVTRAQRSGDLRSDVTGLDIAWLIEYFGRLGPSEPGARDAVRERVLAIALDGLRTGIHQPLPGAPPGADQYERRWVVKAPASVEVKSRPHT
jgi:hypothetical protein